MYRKIQLATILLLISIISLNSEPYKPKPILFIHGEGSNSRAWDAPSYPVKDFYINGHLRENFFTDSLLKDSIIADSNQLSNILQDTITATGDYLTGLLNLKTYGTGTYAHFWHKMEPIVNKWREYQDSLGIQNELFTPYIEALDNGWPNKTFLEVISFDDAWGSVDPHGGFPDRYNTPANFTGGGDELKYRIRQVLGEYYGTGPNDVTGEGTWLNDTSAKVILIAHSMGNQAVQEALMQDTILAYHLYKYITVDGVVNGTVLATPGSGDNLIASLYNHPVILPFKSMLGVLAASINIATIMSKIDNNYSSNLPESGIERLLFETSSELNYLVGVKYVSIMYAMPFGFSIIRTNANQQLPVLRDLAKNSGCVNSHKGEVAERIANAGGKFASISIKWGQAGKWNLGLTD